MLITKITSFTELTLLMISLSGQLKSDYYVNLDITDSYARKCIAEMIRDKKIKRCAYDYGTYLRLKKPGGIKALTAMSDSLYQRYMEVTYGHKFSNRVDFIKRLGNMSEVNNLITSLAWPLDNIKVEYEANMFGRSKKGAGAAIRILEDCEHNNLMSKGGPGQTSNERIDLPNQKDFTHEKSIEEEEGEKSRQGGGAADTGAYDFEEYLKESNRIGVEYFTSRVVKRFDKGTYNLRINLSRFYGVVISDGGIYPVYFIGHELIDWEPGAEQSLGIHIPNIAERSRGRGYSEKMFERYKNGAGIFLVKDYGIVKELVNPDKKSKKKNGVMDPLNVYGNAYVIPLDRKLAEPVLKLITLDDWQGFARKIVFTIEERERAKEKDAKQCMAEAVLDDGSYSWEMISCDISKLKLISNQYIENGVTIICYPWQEEIIQRVMKGKVKTETVEPEDIMKKIHKKGK
jgi:hypothetical protein